MIRLIFIDVEGKGPAPTLNNHEKFEWGAVDFSSWQKDPQNPRTFHGVGATTANFMSFEQWIRQSGHDGDTFKMVSDNVAYDWQFINYYLHAFLKRNILGHSARRIGDFAAGLAGDFYAPQIWKELRRTKHDHHPVHDALGNVEAFAALLNAGKDRRNHF